jgi:hypothetical protein
MVHQQFLMTFEGFLEKTKGKTLENCIYKSLCDELSDIDIQQEIKKNSLNRNSWRNTGYAVDVLLHLIFRRSRHTINIGNYFVVKRGTLAFTTEVTL